jgi:hypothetical protein
MRIWTPVVLILAALLCSNVGAQNAKTPPAGQGVPPPDALARLDRLQQEVNALKAEVTRLKGKPLDGSALDPLTAALRRDIDQIAQYLRDQAQAAKTLSEVLDEAEAKGFTAGINPDSRTLLLGGWRAQLAGAQNGLPAAAAKAEPKR